MTHETAKAVIHSATGIPHGFGEYAYGVAFELAMTLLEACKTLTPDSFPESIDALLNGQFPHVEVPSAEDQ